MSFQRTHFKVHIEELALAKGRRPLSSVVGGGEEGRKVQMEVGLYA